jgi:hypothetical protein
MGGIVRASVERRARASVARHARASAAWAIGMAATQGGLAWAARGGREGNDDSAKNRQLDGV